MKPLLSVMPRRIDLKYLVGITITAVRKARRSLIFSCLVACCLIGGAWIFRNLDLWRSIILFVGDSEDLVYYRLKRASFTVEVPAFGELRTASSTEISVPRLRSGGIRVYWVVKNGSRIKAGDTLIEFDASPFIREAKDTENNLEATLRQLEVTVLHGSSDMRQIEAERDIAKMELAKARTQAPKDERIFTRNEIIEGELNVNLSTIKVRELGGKLDSKDRIYDTARKILVIDRRAHEKRLGTIKESLDRLKILAPHDGLVLHQVDDPTMGEDIKVGDTCWPGQVLFTIPDTSAIEARVFVLESDSGNLRVGQPAQVVVDSHPNVRFDATIKSIETIARKLARESPVKYFEVRLGVRGKVGEILKPGKSVQATITAAKMDDILTVPRSAVVEEAHRFFVWVKGPDGPVKTQVEVAPGDAARIVLRSGVGAGESVLLNPPKSQAGSEETVIRTAPVPGGAKTSK